MIIRAVNLSTILYLNERVSKSFALSVFLSLVETCFPDRYYTDRPYSLVLEGKSIERETSVEMV
jgi:hypothetical protein